MMQGPIRYYWQHGDRFQLLLGSLVATLLLVPLAGSSWMQNLLSSVCFTLVFVTGALANRRRPWIFKSAVALAAAAIGLAWMRLALGSRAMPIAHISVDVVFFAFTAVMILIAVMRDYMASTQAISGAVCVYLLMGLGWAHGYLLLEYVEAEPFRYVEASQQPDFSTENPDAQTVLAPMIYYSFVTMTTLGYGDIIPRSQLARTITWMQAVAGQLFVAVLIARLVSELPSNRRGGDEGNGRSP